MKTFFSSLIGVLLGSILTIGILYTQKPIYDDSENDHNNDNSITDYDSGFTENEDTRLVIEEPTTILQSAINEVYDAVVFIETYSENKLISTGTGFIYKVSDNSAYVATNQHVIENGTSINIVYHDMVRVESVEVVGSDIYTDIAVLKMPKQTVRKIAKLGNSETMQLGDAVFTVGSPLGIKYIGSVTKGIISGIDRFVPVNVLNENQPDWEMEVLQTDAAINPGNSGGPLVNLNGEVIGINSLKLVQAEVEGMGFAIPIDVAKRYISDIEAYGKVVRPTFGINMVDINPSTKTTYNIPNEIVEGVYIIEVVINTPAHRAGIKNGDVIVAFDDRKVKTMLEFRKYLYQKSPNDKVYVTILRNGERIELEVVLDTSPLE